jgi:hypothetical protein
VFFAQPRHLTLKGLLAPRQISVQALGFGGALCECIGLTFVRRHSRVQRSSNRLEQKPAEQRREQDADVTKTTMSIGIRTAPRQPKCCQSCAVRHSDTICAAPVAKPTAVQNMATTVIAISVESTATRQPSPEPHHRPRARA